MREYLDMKWLPVSGALAGSLLLNDCGNGNAGNNPVPEAVENFYVGVQRLLPDTGRRHRLCR